jgi:hypothetical protein
MTNSNAGWLGSNEVSPQIIGLLGARWRSTPATRREKAEQNQQRRVEEE